MESANYGLRPADGSGQITPEIVDMVRSCERAPLSR